jgi:hypothetical protein
MGCGDIYTYIAFLFTKYYYDEQFFLKNNFQVKIWFFSTFNVFGISIFFFFLSKIVNRIKYP